MAYPPAAHMMAVLVLSGDALTGAERARELAEQAKRQSGDRQLAVIGPTEALKISDVYRYVFYIKHRDYQVLTGIKDMLEQMIRARQWNADSVQFDFDPMNHY